MTSQALRPAGVKIQSAPLHPRQSSPDQTSSIGFLRGTQLLARQGDRRVESIQPGDDIISRDLGLVRCLAVEQYLCTSNAIWFAPGSLGDSRPDCDLILPADQQVLLRDWRAKAIFGTLQALARAGSLVDGEFICDLGPQEMTLTVLRFSRPNVIYAGGLEVATAKASLCAQPQSTGSVS